MSDAQAFLNNPESGTLIFGATRMVLFDIEGAFWSLRRQLEALAGTRLARAALQQAGTNGGASFARRFAPQTAVTNIPDALHDCVVAYTAAGFGDFQVSEVAWPLGRVVVQATNSFEAWMLRQHGQRSDTPVCAYSAGVLVGFINALADRRDIVCVERTCQAAGDAACTFELLPANEAQETAVVAFDPDPYLSQQLNLLDLLFDQMPMGIAIMDRECRLRRFNPTLTAFIERYSPLPPEQIVPGTSFFTLLPGNEAPIQAIFQRVLAGETVRQAAFQLDMAGVRSYWDAVSAPLRQGEAITGIVHVTTDVTERVLAEQKLQTITTIANNFINMPSDKIDQGIQDALRAIGASTGADRAYIFLYREDGHTMNCVHEWCAAGITPQIESLQALSVSALNWSNHQLQQQQILHIPRVSDLPPAAAAEKQEFTRQNIQSLLVMPMTSQEKVIGFLGFDAVRREKSWTAVDISLLQIVGEIFVNTLEHKRSREALEAANRLLEERVVERTQELEQRNQELDRQRQGAESLRTVLALLNSNRPLPEVLEAITRLASELMGAETAVAIFRYDPSRERFELQASHRLPDVLRKTKSVPVSAIGGEPFKQRKIFAIPNVAQHVAELLPSLPSDEPELSVAFETLRAHFRSYLAVPLVVRDALYGGIAFHFTDQRVLEDKEVTLALTLSEQAALAIENARLVEAERRRRSESERRRQVAEGLRDILARLNSEQSLPELLDAIVAQADLLIDSDVVALYLLNEDSQRLTIQALRGNLPPEVRQVALPVGVGTIGRVVALREPMIVPDVKRLDIRMVQSVREESLAAARHILVEDAHLAALATAIERFQAVLALPLIVQETALGGLAFYYHQPRQFSDEEVSLATMFADQAALAIQNARLRDRAEEVAVLAERHRLARELHDAVTQTLFSASLIADVLPRIWERDPAMGQDKLAELRELTRGALAEMRTLLLELRPATLTESSLEELLQQLAAAVIGRSRLQVEVVVTGEASRPLSPDAQVALYRIAQEALNNVVKHAQATEVTMSLRYLPDCVELAVQDNGRGFDPTAASIHSLGLGIMRERAAKMNATLEVDSAPGKGSRIWVRCGLAEATDEQVSQAN
jgi:signal transduction histidine kinase/predicted hydrocarbon binding protein